MNLPVSFSPPVSFCLVLRHYMVTKAKRMKVNTVHVIFVFADVQVDFIVQDITRRRVSTRLYIYTIFCRLSGHVLPERETAFIDRKVFAGIV